MFKKTKNKKNSTQVYVNKLVRERDKSNNYYKCCSCSNITTEADAGHYVAAGASSYLRYFALNIHAQCRSCNRFGGGGRSSGYGAFMVKLYGSEFLTVLDDFKLGMRYWPGWSDIDLQRIKKLNLEQIILEYYQEVMFYWKSLDKDSWEKWK